MARTGPARAALVGAVASLVLVAALTACASPGDTPSSGSTSGSSSASGSTPGEETGGATPTPSSSSTGAAAAVPDDCRAILTADVLAQLADVPLNDPAFGPSGVQPDGSLICIWADPAADTTGLRTEISSMSRGPALDMLNQLANDEGFTCYTPDGGTRCEKTWPNETYPVTDGRTLFWRDDILIDTQYSNLAPTGYTAAIIDSIWG
ncbi:hypothetical protein [Microbacterium sp. SS28]|uniref:hypothetical protein n=1 Tax=Microbacterium sp. SS28 TaxID=2919948 RepID=UPI001FAAEA42|nr:hypothetical protein [Microbacterium sp. SS28]